MTKSELIAQLSEADTGNELLEILENLETQDDDNSDD